MTPVDQAFARIKDDALKVRSTWPSDKDVDKAHKAFAAYDLGFKPLIEVASRAEVLKLLDKLFGVGERHVRRAETIRLSGAEAQALETFVKTGQWSLEAVEHVVIRGVNADALEIVWRSAPQAARVEFLKRVGLS